MQDFVSLIQSRVSNLFPVNILLLKKKTRKREWSFDTAFCSQFISQVLKATWKSGNFLKMLSDAPDMSKRSRTQALNVYLRITPYNNNFYFMLLLQHGSSECILNALRLPQLTVEYSWGINFHCMFLFFFTLPLIRITTQKTAGGFSFNANLQHATST